MFKTLSKTFAISLLAIFGASFLLVGDSFARDRYPEQSKEFYVNDLANVISEETENYIIDCNKKLAPPTGAQIVVMTVESLDGESIETYAHGVFEQYGIGASDKNNGTLILLSIGDRQSRIEVGYGAEGFITDAGSGRIQDNYMIPEYKNNNWEAGLKKGFDVILALYEKEYEVEISEGANIYDYDNMPDNSSSEEMDNIINGFETGFFFTMIFAIIGKNNKKNRIIRLIIGAGAIVFGIFCNSALALPTLAAILIPLGSALIISVILSAMDITLGSGSGGRYYGGHSSGGHSSFSSGGSHGGGGHSGGGGSSRSF